MFNIKQLECLCEQYKINYKVFDGSDTIILSTPFDDWMIKYVNNKNKPYCLLHRSKTSRTKNFHTQRYVNKFCYCLESIITHKKILVSLYSSPKNTYNCKDTYKNKNKKRRGNYHSN